MDKITQGLFPEKKCTSSDSYLVMTKEECQKKISEIKALMAQNPAESGGGENNSKENLQNMLEQYESAYADAPDTAEKTETDLNFCQRMKAEWKPLTG